MLVDGFQVEREGVLGEPVQHGLHGLARPRTVCVCAQRSAMEVKLTLGIGADLLLLYSLPTLRVGPFRERYFS